jgi:hypothetical protein
LGGSACAGKSTVAGLLAERYGLALYAWDDHFEAHRARALEKVGRWPAFEKVMDQPATELFTPPASERAAELTAFYRDEFQMVLEDLAAFPGDVTILVEGAGIDPEALRQLGVPRHRALWLLVGDALRRRRYREHRGGSLEETLRDCPAPEAAFAIWMRRDALRRERLEGALSAAGYRGWDVGEEGTSEWLTGRVASHFELA